jgi:protein-S-isoprenylcysteine O-methyltransferase Ste14
MKNDSVVTYSRPVNIYRNNSNRKPMKHGRILPPTYLFNALAAMVLLHLFVPLHSLTHYPWNIFGIVPLSAGIFLNLAADRSLKKRSTTVKPFEVSSALVTSGVFRFSRHPMYLGMICILSGVALLLGSLSPFIIIPIFALLMDSTFISAEESMLDTRFGDEWRKYKSTVRRWL